MLVAGPCRLALSRAVTNGQDARRSKLQSTALFVLARKASTNNHTTTIADPSRPPHKPDWQHTVASDLTSCTSRLGNTRTPEDARQHIHIRKHAGSSTTTTSSATAYAWRCWRYDCNLPLMTVKWTNRVQDHLRLHHLHLEDCRPDQPTRKSREEYVLIKR